MKIEMIKEESLMDNTWYSIYVDGKYMAGSYNENTALSYYEKIKSNPKVSFKEVLKSDEIDVSLKEKKNGE